MPGMGQNGWTASTTESLRLTAAAQAHMVTEVEPPQTTAPWASLPLLHRSRRDHHIAHSPTGGLQ